MPMLIGNRTSYRPILSVIILVINMSDKPNLCRTQDYGTLPIVVKEANKKAKVFMKVQSSLVPSSAAAAAFLTKISKQSSVTFCIHVRLSSVLSSFNILSILL